MKIKERAVYAWGRIVDLFKPRKPEIEVEFEEMPEDVPEEVSEELPEEITRAGTEEIPSRMTDEYKAWLAEQMGTEEDPGPFGQ